MREERNSWLHEEEETERGVGEEGTEERASKTSLTVSWKREDCKRAPVFTGRGVRGDVSLVLIRGDFAKESRWS
jgi:hypothetical protein